MEKLDKFQKNMIDNLIEELKKLKENGTNIEINITPGFTDEIRCADGTMFAHKMLSMTIVWDELFTKNENNIFDSWKPYRNKKSKI